MTIRIGNAPCSWGVEFASDPRNPTWQTVLKECAAAGYKGIELGPVGFMPEDPAVLADALAGDVMSQLDAVDLLRRTRRLTVEESVEVVAEAIRVALTP